MPSYRITLAYDGTDFEGWQVQPPREGPEMAAVPRTIQGVLEEALAQLAFGTAVRVVAAGRTDAGVHALGQVASFSLPRDISAEDLQRALNGLLPRDLRVLKSAVVPASFDARRNARSKLYRYELDLGLVRLPTRSRFAGYHRGVLDPDRVREMAAVYVGTHDFAALASAGGSVKTTVRTVQRSEVLFEPEPATGDPRGRFVYEVVADGFLRKMVRSLVGGLVAAGSGAMTVTELRRAMESGDRQRWPPPAEACGLFLVSVDYADERDLAVKSRA